MRVEKKQEIEKKWERVKMKLKGLKRVIKKVEKQDRANDSYYKKWITSKMQSLKTFAIVATAGWL